jgi:hypothetical protein
MPIEKTQTRRWREPPSQDEPDWLDDTMTPAELIFALEHLNFTPQSSTRGSHGLRRCVISLDKGVRDYLIAAVAARHNGK